MAFAVDARIPVILATPEQAGPLDAVLVEGDGMTATARFSPSQRGDHPPGCACCLPRNAAGRALATLLQARARGQVPFFTRVVACTFTEAGRVELAAALDRDPVASACFRLTA